MDDSASHTSLLEITSKIMIASVIIFFMVIIIIFLLHLYARCLWSATPEDPAIVAWRRQLAQQNQPSGRAPRQKGLDRSTLRSLPVAVYDPKEFKDGLECAVCLSELQQGEKVRVLPDCSHGFHLECIDKWFHSHSTCPICRTLVVAAASNEAVSGSDSNQVEPQQDEGDVDSSGGSMELPVFPTNVLFWGDETQVRATSLEGGSAAASSSGKPHEMLVIDIPMSSERCSNPPTPSSTARLGAEDGSRSPVVSRMKSLKRLLSRGKRVNPFYSGSSSSPGGDAEQV